MTNVKRIGINMISGGAGYLIPMAINIFSTPYVLGKLGEEAYGLQVLANVIIGYFIVADMGMDIPITQKIAGYHANSQQKILSQFLAATSKIYVIIGLCGGLLLIAFTNQLISLLTIPPLLQEEARAVFFLSAFGFLASIFNMWGKAVFNGIHRYDIANAISIFNNLFGIVLGIILISYGFGIVGFFFARILGFGMSNLLYALNIKKFINGFKIFPLVDLEIWTFLKKQIGYGFLLRLSGMIFSKMDQSLVSAWVGIAAVTVYSFPMLIATTLSGLIANVTHFAFPMVSAVSASSSGNELERFFYKITKFIVVFSTLSFLPFLVLGDKVLALWISPNIASQSTYVLKFLILGFYINSCLNIGLNSFVAGLGWLKNLTIYSVCRAITLFGFFLILIRPFGIEGAGFAYVIVLLVDTAFVVYIVKVKLNFSLKSLIRIAYLKPILLGLILVVLLFALKISFNVDSWVGLIFLVAIFEVAYLILAYAIKIFDEAELEILRAGLRKMKLLR
jgi:O-antigen/teichoic acid export membrane protein